LLTGATKIVQRQLCFSADRFYIDIKKSIAYWCYKNVTELTLLFKKIGFKNCLKMLRPTIQFDIWY